MRTPARLRDLPGLLRRAAAALDDVPALRVQAHHLRDLEREAFHVRIARLLAEREPVLADFDGDAIAAARGYADRPAAAALAGFAAARATTLAMLARIGARDALRSGTQDGVGFVMLAHLPQRILDHDRSHALELADLAGGEIGSELRRWAAGIAAGATTPCNQRPTRPPVRRDDTAPRGGVEPAHSDGLGSARGDGIGSARGDGIGSARGDGTRSAPRGGTEPAHSDGLGSARGDGIGSARGDGTRSPPRGGTEPAHSDGLGSARGDGIGSARGDGTRSAPRGGIGPALHRVQHAIVAALPDGDVTTRRLCAALGLSPRTLQRRLAHRGLTVACLVEETRRALALDRLCTGMPLPQIAAELGFAGTRSLGRAFKRWTGHRLTHARARC